MLSDHLKASKGQLCRCGKDGPFSGVEEKSMRPKLRPVGRAVEQTRLLSGERGQDSALEVL